MENIYLPWIQKPTKNFMGFPFPFIPTGRFGLPMPRKLASGSLKSGAPLSYLRRESARGETDGLLRPPPPPVYILLRGGGAKQCVSDPSMRPPLLLLTCALPMTPSHPKANGVTVVVGSPVQYTSLNPGTKASREEVDVVWEKYFDQLQDIFDRYKVQAGYPDHTLVLAMKESAKSA